jgi:hypothetical protein
MPIGFNRRSISLWTEDKPVIEKIAFIKQFKRPVNLVCQKFNFADWLIHSTKLNLNVKQY